MAFKANEYRAIDWYAKEHNLVPQLSAYPTIYFLNRETNEIKKIMASHIVMDYMNFKKEAAKERARLRKQEKKS